MISRWAVWLVNLDPVVGSEQGKARPAVIISRTEINELLNVCTVIPLSSLKEGRKIYPNEAFFPVGTANLSSDSIALCGQIRTIDKKRLIRCYGSVERTDLHDAVEEALRFHLSL